MPSAVFCTDVKVCQLSNSDQVRLGELTVLTVQECIGVSKKKRQMHPGKLFYAIHNMCWTRCFRGLFTCCVFTVETLYFLRTLLKVIFHLGLSTVLSLLTIHVLKSILYQHCLELIMHTNCILVSDSLMRKLEYHLN